MAIQVVSPLGLIVRPAAGVQMLKAHTPPRPWWAGLLPRVGTRRLVRSHPATAAAAKTPSSAIPPRARTEVLGVWRCPLPARRRRSFVSEAPRVGPCFHLGRAYVRPPPSRTPTA